jgi:hypothetical protein
LSQLREKKTEMLMKEGAEDQDVIEEKKMI